MNKTRRMAAAAAAFVSAAGLMAAQPVSASSHYLVTTEAPSGEGSLSAAFDSGASRISFARDVDAIDVDEPLVYSGDKPLTIDGGRAGVQLNGANNDGSVIEVASGADVRISRVDIYDAKDHALLVTVPENRTRTVDVILRDVIVATQVRSCVRATDENPTRNYAGNL